MKAEWQARNLGDLCNVIGGGTPPKDKAEYYSGDIPWATVRDMRSEMITKTEFKVTPAAVKSSSTNIIPGGNVVIATRVGLGKVCLLGQDTAINQDLRGIVPINQKDLEVRFLFWWLKSISDVIVAEGTGATVQGVKLPFVKGLQLPLPPLPEQQRIVSLLDEAFDSIATAKANAEKNLQNARAIFESHLQSVFTQRGDGWQVKRISEIAKHSLGKMLDKAKNKGIFQPYLRNLNVRWFDFDLSDVLQMPFQPEEFAKYTATKGDVLICEGGYPGRAAIWDDEEPIHFQKALHRVRFHETEHNKWFLYYLYVQDKSGALKRHFNGAGIQHFTGEALTKFELPFPPLPELRKSVAKFDALSEQIKSLESVYQQKLTAFDELKKSLLHRAFNGDL